MKINEITIQDLQSLDSVQFSDILLRLLKFESERYNFTGTNILVPLRINVADEGEDGRIECDATNGSKWIKKPLSIFQVKACDLKPQNLYLEFFSKGEGGEIRIKKQIEEILDKGGDYVFFISHNYGPVGIKGKRAKADKAIEYCNSILGKKYKNEQVIILEGNKIKDWVNEYINVVIKVKEYLGLSRPEGVKTVEEWGTFNYLNQNRFITNDWIIKQIATMRAELLIPETVIRLTGHSGVGKSRLVYEAFKASDDGLKSNAIYIDSGTAPASFISTVGTIVTSSQCIFIVDNCDRKIHNKLAHEVTRIGSKCSLISIGYDMRENISDSGDGDPITGILYENRFNTSVVPILIKNKVGNLLSDAKIEWISEKTDYFPDMALRYSEVLISSKGNFSTIIGEEGIKQLLFGGKYSSTSNFDELYSIARVFAIFKYFPAPLNYSIREDEETQLLQRQITFITNICDPKITQRKYNEACEYFEENRILVRRGRYLMMSLNHISINLAKEWWKSCPIKEAFCILTNAPEKLINSINERFKYLDFTSQVRNIAESLFGENSPYANANELNKESVSRLFCSLVEVNPEALLKTLVKLYLDKPVSELIKVDVGRPNLVMSLEKLCFLKGTFNRASKILYGLAVSENENTDSNSRAKFTHLFQPKLAGTEANLIDRIQILQYGLDKNDIAFTTLAVEAIFSGFRAHYSVRMGGAERQGMNLYEDFRPTWDEIDAYWEHLKELLIKIWEKNECLREFINSKFYIRIREILKYGPIDLIFNLLEFLEKNNMTLPSKVYSDLETALVRDNLSVEKIDKVNIFLRDHNPTDTNSILIRLVVTASYKMVTDENGKNIDETEKTARKLGREFGVDKIQLDDYLGTLLTGKQMYTSYFIEDYCKNLSSNKVVDDLWDNSVEILNSISEAERNVAVLDGILTTLQSQDRVSRIISLVERLQFSQFVILLANLHFETSEDMIKLIELYRKDGRGTHDILDRLSYAKFVYSASFENIRVFCDYLQIFGTNGKWAIISILYRRKIATDHEFGLEQKYIREFLLQNNLFKAKGISTLNEYTELFVLVEMSLKIFTDEIFVRKIIEDIILTLKSNYDLSLDVLLVDIIRLLIESNFDLFWESFISEVPESVKLQYHSENLLGSHHGNSGFGSSDGVLFLNTEKYGMIVEWCKANPNNAKLITDMMPIYDIENKTWHSFAKKMIDEFGESIDFLTRMSSNMGSFGFWGSPIGYYENEIDMYKQLLGHPILQVKDFASKQIEILQKLIDREKLEEEERFLGL